MKVKSIRIVSEEGQRLFCGEINDLPVVEDYILSKCLEYFNDSEPCIIHRTFVLKRYFLFLQDELLAFGRKGQNYVKCDEIADLFKYVDLEIDGSGIYIDFG